MAQGVVARQRRGARRDEIAHAGQARERVGVRTQGQAQARDLGQTARDDRGGRVVAEAQAVGDAHAHRDHVLVGAAQFHAQHIRVGVRTEVRRCRGRRDGFGGTGVGRGDDGRRGLSRGDLAGQVGARDHHLTVGFHTPHLAQHLRHPLMRAHLDALHQGHHERVCGHGGGPGGDDAAHVLRRQRHHREVDAVQGIERIGGRAHGLVHHHPGQEPLIGATLVDPGHHIGVATPQGHLAPGIGQDCGKGGAPRAGTEHRRPGHA